MIDFTAMILAVGPELWLVAMALIGVLVGATLKDRFNNASTKFGALALFAAAAFSLMNYEGGEAFNGLVRTNMFVNFAKFVSYVLAGFALLASEGFLKRHGTIRYEYALLILLASFGMGMILSAADLMTLYMGVETLSLSSYVLAAFHRDSAKASEAGLKYFVLGALASGMLLYGASLVYGFSGSTEYVLIAAAEPSIGMMFGMVLMIVGLAFKVSAAPMHIWTPDVYEGAPTPVAIALSILIFSMAGLPPFGGFFGKWEVLSAGVEAGLMPVVIILVLASVVSLGYYLRLIKIMWFDEPTEKFEAIDGSVTLTVLLAALIAGILFLFFINALSGWASTAAMGLTG